MGIKTNIEISPNTTDATAIENDVRKDKIFYGKTGKMIGNNPMENQIKRNHFHIVLDDSNYPTISEYGWYGDFGTGILINNNYSVHYNDISYTSSMMNYSLGGRRVFQLNDVNHLLSFTINGKKYSAFDNNHMFNNFGGDICAYERWDSSSTNISPKICIKRESNNLILCIRTHGEFDFIFEYV